MVIKIKTIIIIMFFTIMTGCTTATKVATATHATIVSMCTIMGVVGGK